MPATKTTSKPTLERLYSLPELQAAGYADRTTLFRMVKAGDIPAVIVGRRGIRIRESDLHLLVKPVEISESTD